MNRPFCKYYTRIPERYKDEIIFDLTKDNLYRIFISTIILAVAEILLLLFFSDKTFNTESIILLIVFINTVFLPIVYHINHELTYRTVPMARIVQYVYLFASFLLFIALSLIPQGEFVTINTYVMALFGTSALLFFHPLESGILYAVIYGVFFMALPHYQAHPDIVLILRINAAIMTVFAWVIARMVYRMKLVSLIDKKTIEHKNELLREMAKRDSMTSLLNHATVFYRLRDEMDEARLTQVPLSVVMLDIDNFKTVNDSLGHQAGDKVIIGIAGIITDNCRATDIVGRYGGEEFLIVMPGTDLERATLTAERIRVLVEAAVFEAGTSVTISAGVCQFNDQTTEELVKKADEYLYMAKNQGRNRIEAPVLMMGSL